MRFSIEKNALSSSSRPELVLSASEKITFHQVEAESAREAVSEFLRSDGSELVGEVIERGDRALATAKRDRAFYVLQLYPGSVEVSH
ncbi:MAG: hypothetical protein WBX15_13315 [Thermoanaerobaculia bacterium]